MSKESAWCEVVKRYGELAVSGSNQLWFEKGWDAAIEELLQPQGPETCKLGHPTACLVPEHRFVAMKECDEPYDVYKCDVCRRQMHDHRAAPGAYYMNAHCSACIEIARAVDEFYRAVVNIRCDNAQFTMPKWIKDEVQRIWKELKR